MPLGTARDAVIAVQAWVLGALAAENARLAEQAADLAARVEHGTSALTAIRDASRGNPLNAAHPRPSVTSQAPPHLTSGMPALPGSPECLPLHV